MCNNLIEWWALDGGAGTEGASHGGTLLERRPNRQRQPVLRSAAPSQKFRQCQQMEEALSVETSQDLTCAGASIATTVALVRRSGQALASVPLHPSCAGRWRQGVALVQGPSPKKRFRWGSSSGRSAGRGQGNRASGRKKLLGTLGSKATATQQAEQRRGR